MRHVVGRVRDGTYCRANDVLDVRVSTEKQQCIPTMNVPLKKYR